MRRPAGRAVLAPLAVLLVVATAGCGGTAPLPKLVPHPSGFPVGASASIRGTAAQATACTIYAAPRAQPLSAGLTRGDATTLASAIADARPGSVVCLEPGTYKTSGHIVLAHSGTPSAPIVYRNSGGRALIQYTGGSLDGGILETTEGHDWGGGHDIVIDGLTLDGHNLIGGAIFVRYGSHNVTIENCVIRDTGATGIGLNAVDYVTVIDNTVEHAGYNQGWSSGISLWYGGTQPVYGGPTAWYDRAPGFHNVIAGNVVTGSFDNSGQHSDGSGIIVDGSGSTPPILIADNISAENGGGGFEINSNSGQIWLVNNTGYANGLDLAVNDGEASDFETLFSRHVHFIDNLAYGRRDGSRYRTAYLFRQVDSGTSWAGDLGDNGSTRGLSGATTGNPGQIEYGNPQFLAMPAVVAGRAPWASATAPWRLQRDLQLAPDSPARRAGVDPLAARGLRPALARDLGRYLA